MTAFRRMCLAHLVSSIKEALTISIPFKVAQNRIEDGDEVTVKITRERVDIHIKTEDGNDYKS